MSESTDLPRPRSAAVFDGPDRAHSRAYMKGIGFDDESLSRPTIGIANTWTEAMPCNFHLRGLAEHVKAGVRAGGGTPMEFNTVAVSDGVTMGTQGMKASLVSREVIADSIELMARGYQFDAIVALCACDKTIPGCAMALARLDVPSVLLYGGSIAPGHWHDKDVTIMDVFEAVGARSAGKLSQQDFDALERQACPGAGACGGQFTANTMATVCEILGISPFGSASVPATDTDKAAVARRAGAMVMDVLRRGIRPRQVITKDALENAIAAVAATGGSTNAVLHLLAIAAEANVSLNIDDFKKLNDTKGHDTADAALVHLAMATREAMRPQDTLARSGDEEFVVLMPDTESATTRRTQLALVAAACLLALAAQYVWVDKILVFAGPTGGWGYP